MAKTLVARKNTGKTSRMGGSDKVTITESLPASIPGCLRLNFEFFENGRYLVRKVMIKQPHVALVGRQIVGLPG